MADLLSFMKGDDILKISQTVFKLGSFLKEMEEAYVDNPSLRDCVVESLKKIMIAHPNTKPNPPATA